MLRCPLTLIALLVSSLSLFITYEARAEKLETMQKRLEKGKTVRRQKRMRAGRTEVGLALGSSLGDTYKRSYPISLVGNYYLSDELGFGLSAFFAMSSETALAEEIRIIRPNRVAGEESFSSVSLGAGVDLIYTPLHGKLSLLGISAIKYDLAVTGGIHLLQVVGAQPYAKGEEAAFEEEAGSFKPAPAVGMLSHFFVDDRLAVGVFFKTFMYSRADRSILVGGVPETEESWSLHHFGGLSFSYFTGKSTVGYE